MGNQKRFNEERGELVFSMIVIVINAGIEKQKYFQSYQQRLHGYHWQYHMVHYLVHHMLYVVLIISYVLLKLNQLQIAKLKNNIYGEIFNEIIQTFAGLLSTILGSFNKFIIEKSGCNDNTIFNELCNESTG
eukprot:70185_1